MADAYNLLAEKENPEEKDRRLAQELKEDILLLKDQLEIFSRDSQELEEKLLATYKDEAYYRNLALQREDNLSLRNHRKYADALFNSRNYDEAELAYEKIHTLNEDYLYPYEKRLQIALRLAKADGGEGPGIKRAVPVSQEIIRVFLPKVDELKEKQQKSVLIALQSMAFYSFDPEGTEAYDCIAAQPYLDQLKNISPDFFEKSQDLQQIYSYCSE